MESYLLKILQSNTRVIVPEFGAFIVKQENPLAIVFNEFLQYNDGVLIEAIVSQEGISNEEARQKIDAFILEINETLNLGKSYNLGTMGVLLKSQTGKISLEETGLQTEEKRRENDVISLDLTQEADSLPKAEPPVKKKAEPKPESIESKAKVQLDADITEQDIRKANDPVPQIEKPMAKPKTETTRIVHTETKHTGDNAVQVKKNRRKNILLWAIVIILVDGVIIAYFLKGDDWQSFIKSRNTPIENTVIVEDMPTGDTEEPAETIDEGLADNPSEAIEAEVIQTIKENVADKDALQGVTRYYIVAGAFRDEKNADKLVDELKAKGYKAEKFGKLDNLFHVSYARCNTRDEADKILLKVQKEYDAAAWIKVLD
jgi:nucleoid DNA-binding protein